MYLFQFLKCYYYASKSASDPILIERLANLFNRCSRIELLYWMCPFQKANPFDIIWYSLRNVTVEKLFIEYERNTSKEAMWACFKTIKICSLLQVEIAGDSSKWTKFKKFTSLHVTSMASFVRFFFHFAKEFIRQFSDSINVLCDIARACPAILISAQYWERDPIQFPLRRTSWEEFVKLMNNEDGIKANLKEYATEESQFFNFYCCKHTIIND